MSKVLNKFAEVMKPIQHIAEFKSEYAMIEYLVQLSNLMALKKHRLQKIQTQCLCVLIMCHNRIGNLTSKEAGEWIIAEMNKIKPGFNNNSLCRYRKWLYVHGWLALKDKQLVVAPIFDFKLLPIQVDRVFVFGARFKGK